VECRYVGAPPWSTTKVLMGLFQLRREAVIPNVATTGGPSARLVPAAAITRRKSYSVPISMKDDFLARTHAVKLRTGVTQYRRVGHCFARDMTTTVVNQALEVNGKGNRTPAQDGRHRSHS
jgi:hypothetical protein